MQPSPEGVGEGNAQVSPLTRSGTRSGEGEVPQAFLEMFDLLIAIAAGTPPPPPPLPPPPLPPLPPLPSDCRAPLASTDLGFGRCRPPSARRLSCRRPSPPLLLAARARINAAEAGRGSERGACYASVCSRGAARRVPVSTAAICLSSASGFAADDAAREAAASRSALANRGGGVR